MSGVSRRRFVQGAAGGAAVAAGAFGASRCSTATTRDASELVPWAGPRQAGIVTPRTPYGMVAAYDVVTDDLPGLFGDLTDRIAELTQGRPDRLDPISNAALPPSDTGELGFDDRDDGRLTITLALGASLFDERFGLRDARPPRSAACPRSPATTSTPRAATATCCCSCSPTTR